MSDRYIITDRFWRYLTAHRPDAAKVLAERGRGTGSLVGLDCGLVRCRLTFAGIPWNASPEFDRHATADDACMVLSGYPEDLASSERPANAKTLDRDKPLPVDCFVDALLLGRMLKMDLGTGRRVPALIVGREAWRITVRIGESIVSCDFDELSCHHDYLWLE